MIELVKIMKRRSVAASIICVLCLLFIAAEQMMAQSTGDVVVTIRLRYSDGTTVSGEPIILQQLPEEEPISPRCLTNANGECTWAVGRGLYQLLFARPLDNISALAVAEGGLRGLGITVGDENITYSFTFHSDGRVYFDAAPEAAVPAPIIPVGDVLHGGIQPPLTPSPLPSLRTGLGMGESVSETPTPEPTADPETAVDKTSGSSWRLILIISGGLLMGGGLHIWSRIKQKKNQSPVAGQSLSREEESDA